MEQLMKKAITEFKKLRKGEIRTVAVHEASYCNGKPDSALFFIEYAVEPEADYESVYIAVSTDGYVDVR